MFPWQPFLGKQIFTSKECRLSIEALYEKVKSNSLIVPKKLPQMCILYPVAKDPDLSIKAKMLQKVCFL